MRLSAWRAAAPRKDAASAKLAAIVDQVLATFGAGENPHCWVAWGDEPGARYSILVPTDPGLIHCFVRVNVSGEGPRTTTKLVRWNRVSIGELATETQAGHRLLSFQVEGQVLRGVDGEADRVAAFALRIIAAIDGRPLPPVEEKRARASRTATSRRGTKATGATAARTSAPTRSSRTGAKAPAAADLEPAPPTTKATRSTAAKTGPTRRRSTGR